MLKMRIETMMFGSTIESYSEKPNDGQAPEILLNKNVNGRNWIHIINDDVLAVHKYRTILHR